MTGLLSRIGFSDAKRVYVGIVLTCLIGLISFCVTARTIVPGPDSKAALLSNPGELLAFKEELPPKDNLIAIIGRKNLSADESQFISAREDLYQLLKTVSVDKTVLFGSVKTAGHSMLGDDLYTSKDKAKFLVFGTSEAPVFQTPELFRILPNVFEQWRLKHPEYTLSYLSTGTINNELFELINRDLDRSLIFTIPLSLIILLFSFRSVGASLLTIGISVICLINSLGISVLVSHFIEPISATSQQLVVLLVMAIATDYTLFFVTRVRSEVTSGRSYSDGTSIAQATTGSAIFWSGVTVATSLLGLFLMQDTVLASMGIVSMLSVAITLAYVQWLLPPLIRLMKSKIEYGAVWCRSSTFPSADRWIVWSCKNPKFALLITLIPLLSLSYYSLKLNLGSTVRPDLMPDQMESVRAFNELKNTFPNLTGTDFFVIAHNTKLGNLEENEGISQLLETIQGADGISGPLDIAYSQDKRTARYKFMLQGSSDDPKNIAFVHSIRNTTFPSLSSSFGVDAYLSGKLAYDIDQKELYAGKTGLVFIVILFLSFVSLFIAFRSLVVPLKAIALNLLSTAAAFGLLVLLFQEGIFRYGVIESFVPALLFSVLFGLSMDYHLFLISRIREIYLERKDIFQAVQIALQDTYGVITSAAMIMISVFAVIASLELPIMKQLGIGLACAVLIDATLIRCVLLPASMILLGKWNWYFPFKKEGPLI